VSIQGRRSSMCVAEGDDQQIRIQVMSVELVFSAAALRAAKFQAVTNPRRDWGNTAALFLKSGWAILRRK
jgi:hypothetical protein